MVAHSKYSFFLITKEAKFSMYGEINATQD